MEILAVRIDNFSKKEILEKIEFFLTEPKLHQIATVNPEFVLRAQKDLEFKNILNKADLNVADGVGIWYAFFRYGDRLKNRIAGADLMEMILEIADEKSLKIFLAVNKDGLSNFNEIASALKKKYPSINFVGGEFDSSHQSSVISDPDEIKKDDRLLMTDDCILFCNFGAPFQEKFIFAQKPAKIRIAMGVGGSFDFVTGKILRAPLWMQKIGLEWLWRFLQEPKYRLKRIINAVVVFPIKVLFNK
ncbi:MAG: Glycosyl transferase, WecB/TagA/CpsF family [Parcubacteria group bacterium GW2011_GWD2_38_11]|nr:MAG: Glycosyl transferase, WecB/TagA/CpsF family [Parcubacteria group bacterium GW2011_GWD2_38_11]